MREGLHPRHARRARGLPPSPWPLRQVRLPRHVRTLWAGSTTTRSSGHCRDPDRGRGRGAAHDRQGRGDGWPTPGSPSTSSPVGTCPLAQIAEPMGRHGLVRPTLENPSASTTLPSATLRTSGRSASSGIVTKGGRAYGQGGSCACGASISTAAPPGFKYGNIRVFQSPSRRACATTAPQRAGSLRGDRGAGRAGTLVGRKGGTLACAWLPGGPRGERPAHRPAGGYKDAGFRGHDPPPSSCGSGSGGVIVVASLRASGVPEVGQPAAAASTPTTAVLLNSLAAPSVRREPRDLGVAVGVARHAGANRVVAQGGRAMRRSRALAGEPRRRVGALHRSLRRFRWPQIGQGCCGRRRGITKTGTPTPDPWPSAWVLRMR